MSYLYGDSTASPFRINFVEFLRLVIGFSAHVLRAEEHVREERVRRKAFEQGADAERRSLEQLLSQLSEALKAVTSGPDSRLSRSAREIQERAQQVVEAQLAGLTVELTKDLAQGEQRVREERKSSFTALEKLLLQYDLPDVENTMHLRFSEGGRCQASLEGMTPFGLHTVVELALPHDSPFAHDPRVDKFMDGLELHAPETAGWIRKESRMTPHKLGRYHLQELHIGDSQSLIKLRATPESHAPGYDIVFRAEEPRIQLTKVGKETEGPTPFEPDPADVPSLARFREKLLEAMRPLVMSRRALTSASTGGNPIQEYEGMRSLVEQFILVLSPAVRELAAHSQSREELVLRRMTAEDRREEIFVSKVELRAKILELGPEDRRIFAPLDLDGGPPTPEAASPPRRRDLGDPVVVIEESPPVT
jgi:hypothetical protein